LQSLPAVADGRFFNAESADPTVDGSGKDSQDNVRGATVMYQPHHALERPVHRLFHE